jgi:S-adenosylmethionine:tRNA ribosyltransferase-isomerase
MHTEFIGVSAETIRHLLAALAGGHPIIPVGTTSARTIESLYWLGRKAMQDPALAAGDLVLGQWDAYELDTSGAEDATGRGLAAGTGSATGGAGQAGTEIASGAAAALHALLTWMEGRRLQQLVTSTQLLIAPGYDWKIASGLVTNFHQPESTLLLLVASLIGKDWKKVYEYALKERFRFLSYGDGCLLLK